MEKEDDCRVAKIAAITKVYNDIAASGKPTPEQLKFLDFVKEKPSAPDPKRLGQRPRVSPDRNVSEWGDKRRSAQAGSASGSSLRGYHFRCPNQGD
jgi:hypothetical protein